MRYLFATRPTPEFDDYSTSHLEAGTRYHRRFTVKPGRALMWELEKAVLAPIIAEAKPRTVLDFACGTGRLSHFVETAFDEPEVHGIDVSESMLSVARENARRTTYSLMDSREAIAVHGERRFDLILAFRFFANAEARLRRSVAEDLARLLADDGTLVMNNHRNFWSSSYLGRRVLGQRPLGALNTDIETLFVECGFTVRKKLSLGVWPQGDTKPLLLPWTAVAAVERVNATRLASLHTFGYNTIWVLSKQAASPRVAASATPGRD